MRLILLVIPLFIISCNNSYEGKISKVIDGDSYYLANGKEIRLYGCDAPENTLGHNQAYGREATLFAVNYLEGKIVKLKKIDRDKYGRDVCKVFINDIDFTGLIVDNGLAWVYKKYSTENMYEREQVAKLKKMGLWQQSFPLAPYKFRKNNKIK